MGMGRVVRDSAWVYGSQAVTVFFKFLAGFLVARFLGPTLYGLRAIFAIIEQYEALTHAGTLDAMRRDVPYHRGKGEIEEAERIIENVFGLSVLYSAGVCVALLAAAGVMVTWGVTGIWLIFILWMSAYVGVARLQRFYSTLLAIDKRAALLGQYQSVRAAGAGILSVGLALTHGLEGVLFGILVAEALALIWVAYRVGTVPRVRVSAGVLRRLVAVGFPIMLVSVLFMVLRSLDRILIAAMMSQEMLGYFAVGTILANVMFDTLLQVLIVVLFPRMMEFVGSDGGTQVLRSRYIVAPGLFVAYGLPVVLGAIYLGVHLPIVYLAPEYTPAIAVTKILLMGQYFFAVSTAVTLAGVAMHLQVRMATLVGFAVLINGVLNYAFIQSGLGIEGVAWGTGITFFVYAVICTRFVFARLGVGWMPVILFLGRAVFVFAYTMGLLLLWEVVLIPRDTTTGWADLGLTGLRLLGFLTLYLPVLWFLFREPAGREVARAWQDARRRRRVGGAGG